MTTKWPGCYVPPLPEKKMVGNMDKKFIEDRRKFLEYFCQKISEISYLYYSEEFQIFLRSTNNDVEKALAPLQIVVYEEIIAKYSQCFKHLAGRELNSDATLKLATFTGFLKKAASMFESFKAIAKGVVAAKKKLNESFNNFQNMLMVEYEKSCLVEYTNGKDDANIFKGPNSTKLAILAEKIYVGGINDSLENISEMIRFEDKEVKAMLEAITTRDKYEQLKTKTIEKKRNETLELQNVLSGKTTVKGLFSGKNKEDQARLLEKQINQVSKDIDNLTLLNEMITLIITNHEVNKFKSDKADRYYEIIRKVGEGQSESSKHFQDYWSTVLSSENLRVPQ